jgi:hypothetical protein
MPDGTDVYGDSRIPGNFVQGDANTVKVALKAIGAPGTSSRITISTGGYTGLLAGVGAKGGDQSSMSTAVTQKSPNYPMWAGSYGYGEGPAGGTGQYNEQMGYVCIVP